MWVFCVLKILSLSVEYWFLLCGKYTSFALNIDFFCVEYRSLLGHFIMKYLSLCVEYQSLLC